MNRLSALILLISILPGTYASDTIPSIDSSELVYYSSLKNYLSIHAYGIKKFNAIELASRETDDVITYKPNEKFNLGFGFHYKWLGFAAAFNFPFMNNDEDLLGETNALDLQLDIFARRMLFNVSFQFYQGYYWDNVDQYFDNWNRKDSVMLRPDIVTANLSVGGLYVFNHKRFSFRSVYSNTEWQQQSAGSWLVGGYMSLYGVAGDSSLIHPVLSDSYPDYYDVTQISAGSVGALFGYSYSWVSKKKFYINLTGAGGLAAQVAQAFDSEEKELGSYVKPAPKIDIRIAAGFNNDRYYYGFSVVTESVYVPSSNNSDYSYEFGVFKIFCGIRFGINK